MILNSRAFIQRSGLSYVSINDYGFSGPEDWVTNRQAAIMDAY